MDNIYPRKRALSSEPMRPVDTGAGVVSQPTVADVAISARSLATKEQDRVRLALAELRRTEPNQAALARKLDVKQQTVSAALRGGIIGLKLAMRVATARGMALETLLGRQIAHGPVLATFLQVPGWADAVKVALHERQATPAGAVAVGHWPNFLSVAKASPFLVADLVAIWAKWVPLDVRARAEIQVSTETPPNGIESKTQRVNRRR